MATETADAQPSTSAAADKYVAFERAVFTGMYHKI